MQIKITLFEDAEKWLRDNIQDFAWDSVCAVYPMEAFNLNGTTKFYDEEEDKYKDVTIKDFTKALKLLSEQIGKTLYVGCLTSATELLDTGNWDAEVVDAFFQLAFHKKVIYG